MSKVDNPAPRLRALIYNRVSADPSGRRVSVASQDRENRAFCERQQWDIVGTITDNDRSASRFAARQREGYQRVLAALGGNSEFGRVDVLVAWESSRGERRLDGYVVLRDVLEANRVLYAYKGRVNDMAEGDDRFSTGLDALLDEREAERARDRTLRSHRNSVSEGMPRSFAPYGYTRTYTASGRLKEQVPDPETAEVVARIVRRVLRGDTLYAIAQELNHGGVLPPRAHRAAQSGRVVQHNGWSPTIIRNLLTKPSLAGTRTHKGVVVREAAWEPIVDPGDWARVQALLRAPNRPTARSRSAAYLLSGVAECGVCGAWLRPLLNRGRNTYACAGVNPTSPKGHVARSVEKLDAFVELHVVARLSDPGLAERLRQGGDEVDSKAAAAEREIEGLRARLADFEESAVAGRMSGAAFGRMEQRLLAEIAALEPAARAVVLPPVVADVAGPDAGERWEGLSLMQRRQVVRAFVRVVVHRSNLPRGARGFDASSVVVTPLLG